MAPGLRALVALAVASAAAMCAAQLALHLAAWRAARTRRVCRDDTERPSAAAAIWSVARETVLSLLVLLAWPAGASGPSGDRRRPIVLVHGFASSPASLRVLARRLRRDGWTVVIPRLGAWWRDLDDAADRLGWQLERLHDAHVATDVVLVAHGLAGLAARVLLHRTGRRAGIRLLVTLGTPHGGTLACPRLAVGPLRRDARPGSQALRALAAASLPGGVEAIAIASPEDAVIVPSEHAYWAEACNVSVRGSGHLHLLVSARVYAVVAENVAAVAAPAVRRHGG